MKFLFVIIFLASIADIKSQPLTFESATSQDWAGGVCCIHGTRYTISFSTADTLTEFVFDTLWIGNRVFPIGGPGAAQVIESKMHGKKYFTVMASVSYNKQLHISDIEEPLKIDKQIGERPEYSGAALLRYRLKGKKKAEHVSVPAFKELVPIAYP